RSVDPLHQETVRELLGHSLEARELDVRADEDDALVTPCELVDRAERRVPHTGTSSSASSSRSSSAETRFLWCHAALFSVTRSPLPFTVWQMIALGLSGSTGRLPSASRSASTSWTSTSRTPKPKLRHLSGSGSRLWISSARLYDRNLL